MALAPVRETGPARLLALAGAAGEAFAMNRMKQGMHPAEVDPLEDGEPGRKLHRAEKLLIAGAIGTAAVEVGARVFTEKLGRGGSTGVAGLAVRVAGAAGRRSWKTRAALRAVSVVSGAALAAASAYTRFGVLEAGIESTKDPRHVVEPQRARLEERRARGIVDDSITTGV